MDSSSNIHNNKPLLRKFLKTMPIWDHFDQFRVELQLLEHDVKTYLEKLDAISTRVNALPKLNLTSQLKVLPENKTDETSDVVQIYRKVRGEYVLKDIPTARTNIIYKDKDPLRDESIRMLEQKVLGNEEVYAMIHSGKPWVKCRVINVVRRSIKEAVGKPLIRFRLRSSEDSSRVIDLNKYSIARIQNHGSKLKASKRVIAGKKESDMMPGIIGQEPADFNGNRYLVLMDDGSAHYFEPDQVLPIFGQSIYPWLDSSYLCNSNSMVAAYTRYFFSIYPRRHLIDVSVGDKINLTRNGIFELAHVVSIDCDTMVVRYIDGVEESVHRGSARLTKRSEVTSMLLASLKIVDKFFEKLLVFIKLYQETSIRSLDEDIYKFAEDFGKKIIVSRNHNTARKSTTQIYNPRKVRVKLDGEAVEENLKLIEELDTDSVERFKRHKCSPVCLEIAGLKTEIHITDIIDAYRDVSDLKVPLLLGWKRKLVKVPASYRNTKHKIMVIYEAPCGKIFQQVYHIRRYLTNTNSKLDLDYFSFDRDLVLNSELGCFDAFHFVENIAVESKTGKPLENKKISLINQFSEERLPMDFEYRSDRFPHPLLRDKGFTFNEEFKSCCNCEDDCSQRSACACHRLNEEAFGANAANRGVVENRCQYVNKRLNWQVSTGIFECNSMCSCSSKCGNRVVQNGIKFRLQVRKTLNKGWGVITLDDIPRGAFICTYAAELLDDADQYGDSDMYYADLDYITVNEEQKLAPSDDEKSDEGVDFSTDDQENSSSSSKPGKRKKQTLESSSDSEVERASVETSRCSSSESIADCQIEDRYMPKGVSSKSRYPKRSLAVSQPPKVTKEVRPRSKPVQFRRIHDLLSSHDYTLDARMQGNIGRFFNHSCDPNSSVQNVFIETHDLRFPVVAFFASRTIKALDEITWNYNYKMGSIEGRVMKCECSAPNCRGRIL